MNPYTLICITIKMISVATRKYVIITIITFQSTEKMKFVLMFLSNLPIFSFTFPASILGSGCSILVRLRLLLGYGGGWWHAATASRYGSERGRWSARLLG